MSPGGGELPHLQRVVQGICRDSRTEECHRTCSMCLAANIDEFD